MKKIKERIDTLLGMELGSFMSILLITLFIGFAKGLCFNDYLRYKISAFIAAFSSSLFNYSFTPECIENWLYVIILLIAILISLLINLYMFLWDIYEKKKKKSKSSDINISQKHRLKR